MLDQIELLILDESKWLTASMVFSLFTVLMVLYRNRDSKSLVHRQVLIAMNLFFATMIGMMAFGHLLAVTTKVAQGTLTGSAPLLYLIGIALAIPSAFLILHAFGLQHSPEGKRTTILLNFWLATTLLVLGVHNAPLAAPALFNITYQLTSKRVLGWMILGVAVLFTLGLFVGSLIFLASGQSFEQFKGLD